MKSQKIPIATAKEISKLGYDEVIIVAANYATGMQNVTTYGKDEAACENAAKGGNFIKQHLNWPKEKCNEKPARQKKREALENRVALYEDILLGLVETVENPDNSDVINLVKFVGLGVIARKALAQK